MFWLLERKFAYWLWHCDGELVPNQPADGWKTVALAFAWRELAN